MEEKRPEVITQPLSEPRCVTAHKMKCTGTDPKSYLQELCRAAETHTICEHDIIWHILCAHLYLPLLHFLFSVFLCFSLHPRTHGVLLTGVNR